MDSVHKDHRQRKRRQFYDHGADAFADHELLELLLFYGIARQDVNPIAHNLIEEFGSLEAVFAAPIEALESIDGIGTQTAILLKLAPELMRRAHLSSLKNDVPLDTVERIGIERSREKMEKCELLFAIFDVSKEKDEEDERLLDRISKLSAAKIAILNKCELERKFDSKLLSNRFDAVVEISAKSDEEGTVLALSKIVDSLFTDEKIKTGEDALLSSARQHATLTKAADFISLAIESLRLGFSQDAISSDVERALGAISELDGREVSEEVVSDIFSKFCVGK